MLLALPRLFTILLLACTLVGCGFHLRGRTPWPDALQPLYLDTSTPYSALSKTLREIFRQRGIQLSNDIKHAKAHLYIEGNSLDKQAVNINTQTTARQVILRQTIQYRLSDAKGKALLNTQQVSASQDRSENDNQIASSETQIQALRDLLRERAAQALLTQLLIKYNKSIKQ